MFIVRHWKYRKKMNVGVGFLGGFLLCFSLFFSSLLWFDLIFLDFWSFLRFLTDFSRFFRFSGFIEVKQRWIGVKNPVRVLFGIWLFF